MTKYEAGEWTGESGYTYPALYKDGQRWPYVDRPMLPAETRIIAFALTAIAEGGELSESVQPPEGRVYWIHYDGPTEGVAPKPGEEAARAD